MKKFLFVYHGGGDAPTTPEDSEKMMKEWIDYFGGMGDAVVNHGDAVLKSYTVTKDNVTQDGGANPTTGYSVIQAADYDAACALAKGCPLVKDGSGSVEVAEIMEM